MDIEVAKKANKIIKDVLGRLEEKADIERYKDIPEIFNNASGIVNGNKINAALLNTWMVSQATNAVFLLWRRQIKHDDIEAEWRKLPTTDEMAAAYEELLKEDRAVAEKIEAERREYMDKQHVLDIFKGVLNGDSKEEAERKYAEFQKKLAETVRS